DLERASGVIGSVTTADRVRILVNGVAALDESRSALHRAWSETSFRMQSLRDNPECAREQFESIADPADPGLDVKLRYGADHHVAAPYIASGVRPRIAVLREQGVNSQVEMAAVLYRAGFAPVDVHMTDLIAGRAKLDGYKGIIACGGFSYGDVLGAGEGWAKAIRFYPHLRGAFARYFTRPDPVSPRASHGV